MYTPAKNIHIENNKTVLPYLANKNTVPLPVPDSTSIISVITSTKNTQTKNMNTENSFLNEPTENNTQVSDDSVTSENNLESTIPTVSTIPTNIDTISSYNVNNDTPM